MLPDFEQRRDHGEEVSDAAVFMWMNGIFQLIRSDAEAKLYAEWIQNRKRMDKIIKRMKKVSEKALKLATRIEEQKHRNGTTKGRREK